MRSSLTLLLVFVGILNVTPASAQDDLSSILGLWEGADTDGSYLRIQNSPARGGGIESQAFGVAVNGERQSLNMRLDVRNLPDGGFEFVAPTGIVLATGTKLNEGAIRLNWSDGSITVMARISDEMGTSQCDLGGVDRDPPYESEASSAIEGYAGTWYNEAEIPFVITVVDAEQGRISVSPALVGSASEGSEELVVIRHGPYLNYVVPAATYAASRQPCTNSDGWVAFGVSMGFGYDSISFSAGEAYQTLSRTEGGAVPPE
ncbi:MAG: hypothetical protein KC561_01440 [Myxococcales bacterium]|nr:hypothetical protein [Myxococcales bacterium]